jgi:hypothetical protein
LSGANTYTGGTIVSNGTLLVTSTSGSGTGSGPVTVNSSGTLGGNGIVAGAVAVNSGGTFAPGAGGIGTLTLSNSLSLAAGSTNYFEITKSPLTNDIAKILGALTNGGTLTVANIGVTALTNGDSFKLFNAASYNGNFARVVLPPLASGLAWNTSALNTNGAISVVALASPTISGIQKSGANLIISGGGGTANWPYVVLSTTNLVTDWTPVATNSFDASGNFTVTLTNAISAGQGQAYYRLQLQ